MAVLEALSIRIQFLTFNLAAVKGLERKDWPAKKPILA